MDVMRFNARHFAPTWLGVFVASSAAKDRIQFHRVINVEFFATGLRVTACDMTMLLTGWIPAAGHDGDPPPFGEDPIESVSVRDIDKRGLGLVSYAYSLLGPEEEEMEAVEVSVHVGAAESPQEPAMALEGLAERALVVEVADRELVRVPLYDGDWIDWRKTMGGFAIKRTNTLALAPSIVKSLSQAAGYFGGAPWVFRFGGVNKAAMVEIGDPPLEVRGLILPVSWDAEGADEPEAGR